MGLAHAPATRNLKCSECTTAALYLHWKWAESEEVIQEVKVHINLNSLSLKTEEGPLRVSDLGSPGRFSQSTSAGYQGATKRDIESRRGSIHPARNYRHKATLSH